MKQAKRLLSWGLALAIAAAPGCGSSRQPDAPRSGPQAKAVPNAVRSMGSLLLTIHWPDAPVLRAKVIPTSTVTLRFTITGADMSDYVSTVQRNGNTPQSVTLNDIPTGTNRTLLVEALNQAPTVIANSTTTGLAISTGIQSSSLALIALNPPAITTLNPTHAPWGTPVTISGSNFGSSQGTSSVKFNGVTASINTWASTSIVAYLPDSALTGNVVVTVDGVPSAGSSFTVDPSINVPSPSSSRVSASITLTGAYFGTSQGSVYIGGTPATITSWNGTTNTVSATVPAALTIGSQDVVLMTSGGIPTNTRQITVTPGVTLASPNPASYGTQVTITGTNFGATQGTSTVKFNGTPVSGIASWSNTQIVTTPPVNATTGPLTVTVSNITSNSDYTFTIATASLGVPPQACGAPGLQMNMGGASFGSTQGNSTVKFNGTTASVGSWSDTQLGTVTVPTGATSGDIVINVAGVNSNGRYFHVSNTCIGSISPTNGTAGTLVTINGNGFGSSPGIVRFNGIQATSLTQWNPTQIKANAPSGVSTGSVIVYAGSNTSNGVLFTVP